MAISTDYVNALGAGSGLDTKSIVDAMVTAEGAAKQASIDRNRTEVEAQISEMAKVQSGLNTLREAFAALDDKNDFNFSAMNNSNPDSVYASFDGTVAQKGTYTLRVSQLAESEIRQSVTSVDPDADMNNGASFSFDITVGSGNTHTINLAAGGVSLNNAAEAINNLDIGVNAWVVETSTGDFRLLVQGPSGAANSVTIDDTNALFGLNKVSALVQTAKDAQLTMNGIVINRPSNDVDDLIPGLSLDLVEATNTNVVIAVTQDTAGAQAAITNLVEAYNAFEAVMDEATAIENSEGETGALRSDSGIRAIQDNLKRMFMDDSSTPGASIQRLSDLGISLQRSGEFEVDAVKLSEALKNNMSEVTKLFSANTNNQSPYGDKDRGLAGDIVVQIDDYLSTRGLINTRIDTYDDKITKLDDDQSDLDDKLARVEERYTRQFTTMNKIMDEMKSMQEYLEGQLENLPFTAKND
jgi:flagellar hook-associated protein 2